ncbi:MAG: hypothetical protein AB7O98_08375 [Hyphomonadaceae bacterium]
MSILRSIVAAVAVAAVAACGQSSAPSEQAATTTAPAPPAPPEAGHAAIDEVDASLLAAPNESFIAIEPSEVGVFAAPTVMEALTDLVGVGAHEGGENVKLTVREAGDAATADIVRLGIQDDSVSGGHIRIEFRREPDGWFPTNAYRRTMCARGALANQWTTELCP